MENEHNSNWNLLNIFSVFSLLHRLINLQKTNSLATFILRCVSINLCTQSCLKLYPLLQFSTLLPLNLTFKQYCEEAASRGVL